MPAPESLADDLLEGRKAIAKYYLGRDDAEAVRRITALMREVRQEDRIPFFLSGGRPASRKSWLIEYTRRRAQNLVIA